MRAGMIVSLLATLCGLGCASAYQQTYDQELGRLETQERQRQQMEAAARAEARQYVAVVYFHVGSTVIQEEGYRELLWLVDQIRSYPQALVDVKGYADATGPEQFNQELSEDRAKNVASFLAQQGIAYEQIYPAGFASNFPDETNNNAKGRSRNRRVEVQVR